jgi:pimeloyl-ACP methyl ester carboxylesterase
MPSPPLFIAPAAWRTLGNHLTFNNQRIFYRTAGTGDPLLLLHGFPTCSWDWKDVWRDLANEHQIIAFDYVGFGFSSKPAEASYSIFGYADQAEAVLEKLGISSVHLLAHDLGDTVAQELMARDLERREGKRKSAINLQSVCLLNGGIFPEQHRPRLMQRLLASPLGPWISKRMTEARFAESFAEVFGPKTKPSEAEMAGFWECINAEGGARLTHKLIGYMRERRIHRERWVSALLNWKDPFCFIDGLLDPVSGAHVVARLRELRPGSRIVPLAEVGHYPQTEAPAAVLAAYREFRAAPRS